MYKPFKDAIFLSCLIMLTIVLAAKCSIDGFIKDSKAEELSFTQELNESIEIILSAIAYQESHCNSKAVGPFGEIGLFQLSCDTAKDYMPKIRCKQLFNPQLNYKIAKQHFIKLFEHYLEKHKDINLAYTHAIDAYNRGQTNVDKCTHKGKKYTKKHPYVALIMKHLEKGELCPLNE